MYNYLQYPIGLIETSYGGTPIRLWSSSEAQSVCNESHVPTLWNAMVYPFLQTTIRAAIWYQGESDCDHNDLEYATKYYCAFPELIKDWRYEWSLNSDTSPDFPFGFVQLSTWDDENEEKYSTNITNTTCGDNFGMFCILKI